MNESSGINRILYRDKYVKVHPDRIIIKGHYAFFWKRQIPISAISHIYYKKQSWWKWNFSTMEYGMVWFPRIWWANDGCRRGLFCKPKNQYNVILRTGEFTMKGFTVANIDSFLEAMRIVTTARQQKRFPPLCL